MTLVSEVSLTPPLVLFEDTFERAPDATLTLEEQHHATDPAGRTAYVFFWWTAGCPPEDLRAAMAADPTVATAHAVCGAEDSVLHRVETRSFPAEQPLVFPTLLDHDATTVAATRDADGFHLRVRFPGRDALDAFVDAADDIAGGAEVTRLATVDTAETPGNGGLTDRQRAALELAHERGYFETPKQVGLATLAEEFDVTPQTLSRHLRVAVEKVVADTVEAGTTPPLQDPSQ